MDTRPLGILAADPFGPSMAGPARRSLALAEHLAAAELPIELWFDGDAPVLPAHITARRFALQAFLDAAPGYRAVLLPAQYALKDAGVFEAATVRIVDCTVPFPLETASLLLAAERDPGWRAEMTKLQSWAINRAVTAGDLWLVSNHPQHCWLLGLLTAVGRLSPAMAQPGQSAGSQILRAPFGIDEDALDGPAPDPQPRIALLATLGLPPACRYLLWTGGLWPWMDPATVITAMGLLSAEFADVHLLLPGARSPHPESPEAETIERARQAIRDGALESRVHLIDWIPAADWPALAAGARVHVSADQPCPETLCSYRTRYLEALRWTRPLVCSGFDPLGEALVRAGVAHSAGEGSAGYALVLEEVLRQEDQFRDLRSIQRRYTWSASLATLRERLTTIGVLPHPDGPWCPEMAGNPVEPPPTPSALSRALHKLRRFWR